MTSPAQGGRRSGNKSCIRLERRGGVIILTQMTDDWMTGGRAREESSHQFQSGLKTKQIVGTKNQLRRKLTNWYFLDVHGWKSRKIGCKFTIYSLRNQKFGVPTKGSPGAHGEVGDPMPAPCLPDSADALLLGSSLG